MDKNPDYSQLLKLAQSPAGQQLLKLLQQSGGDSLQSALTGAGKGDFTQAKQVLTALLSDPEAQKLLKQLEDSQ